ncbi:HEAT repeat domain-containing protein [Horticoccus sp. 23ND18S-11]|uniref:HEAT repeat domain-containing protein n=1 Tax=Horticoccus sp. 23ND18S-11 TaxID=3391832 RepID=UPI0039C96E7F
MSFFDRFRAKWKSPDPAVREAAVASLDDHDMLQTLAESDPHEGVRRAAVQAMTDQETLARIARKDGPLAVAAMKRLSDPSLVKSIALTAESRAVRELAIEKIDDGVTLHRIATSDTDSALRLKAKLKRMGPDQTRDYIRSELSKLQLANRKADEAAAFCGTLDDVCLALIGDSRFRINGGVEPEIPGLATVRDLQSSPGGDAPNGSTGTGQRAQFLAFKRGPSGDPVDGSTSNVFFEINVWRTDQNTFVCRAEEKRLKITADAAEWSRISNGSGIQSRTDKKTTPQ